MPLKFSTNVTESPIHYKLSVEAPASTIEQILNDIKPTIPQDAADEISQSVISKEVKDGSIVASWKTGE